MPEKKTIAEVVKKMPLDKNTSEFEKLYNEALTENQALKVKVAEYEKLCKAYAERERKANEALQRATLEYNARTKYMLDCVKHAYISMQFAVSAAEDNNKQGGIQ